MCQPNIEKPDVMRLAGWDQIVIFHEMMTTILIGTFVITSWEGRMLKQDPTPIQIEYLNLLEVLDDVFIKSCVPHRKRRDVTN
jgi:hypothetical protein